MSSLLARLIPQLASAPSEAKAPSAERSAPASARTDLLFDEEITNERLLAVFRQAYLEVESAAEGRLCITVDGIRILVKADPKYKMIFFSAYFGLKADAPLMDKLAFANRANDRMVLARFSVLNDTTLFIDYQLSVRDGTSAAAIVHLVQRLPRVMLEAIGGLDSDKVVS